MSKTINIAEFVADAEEAGITFRHHNRWAAEEKRVLRKLKSKGQRSATKP